MRMASTSLLGERTKVKSTGRRVLVVSPSVVRRKILGSVVRRMGCRVACAKPGPVSSRAYRRGCFNLVIVDLPPGISQFDSFPELVWQLSLAPNEALCEDRPAFLLLSDEAGKETHGSAFLHEQLVGVLRKPLRKAMLKRMVAELLDWEACLRTERQAAPYVMSNS